MREKMQDGIWYIDLSRNFISTIERWSTTVKIIPAWLPANAITALRAILIIPIYFAFQSSQFTVVLALLLLALFTDIVDGAHARYRNQVSNLGRLLDPAADKILLLGTLYMAGMGRVSLYVIYTVFCLEIILVLLAVVVAPVIMLTSSFKVALGANAFGKVKFWLEGIALVVLLAGLNVQAFHQAAEVVLWCGALAAVLSIALHAKPLLKNGVRQRSLR